VAILQNSSFRKEAVNNIMKQIFILLIAFILVCTVSAQEKIVAIKVFPDQVTVAPGQTYRFIAQGFNGRYEEVQFQPNWIVEGKGRITRDGVYTAGNNVGEMDFVKAVYPRTQAQGTARVLIRLKKEEPPVRPVPAPVVKPAPKPVPAPAKPAPMPSEVVRPRLPVHAQPVPAPVVKPAPKPVPAPPAVKPQVPHHPMPKPAPKKIQVIGWDIKKDGLFHNRLRVRGKVFTEPGNLLQLVIEGVITDTVIAEVRIHMKEEAFSFEGKYFKTTAKACKLVIYDIEENKVDELRQEL
jgi:hypothetical protein